MTEWTDMVAMLAARLAELPKEVTALRAEVQALTEAVARVEQRLPSFATVDEAAKALSISVATVRRMIKAGEIPSITFGRSVRVDFSKLKPVTEDEIRQLAWKARHR